MLYNFALQLLVFLSLGTIIIVLGRAMPRVEDEVILSPKKKDYLNRIAKSLPMERADAIINVVLHKILRKTKIAILRADNVVTDKLRVLREVEKGSQKGPSLLP